MVRSLEHTVRLRNARVLDLRTGGVGQPQDLYVSAGRIVRAHGRAPIIDVEERLVMPGLWDNHVHFATWARSRRVGTVRHATSAFECARMAGELARSASLGSVDYGRIYVAGGFNESGWPDAPSLAMLDDATDRPVVLVSHDLHVCWANSAAFAVLGLDANLAGRIVETQAFEVQRHLSADIGPDDELLTSAGAAAAALGVVGIVDVEMDDAPDRVWASRYDKGFRWFKTRVACYPDALDGVIDRGLSTGTLIRELVKMGPLKIIADGAMTSRTAHTTFPYPNEPEHPHGVLNADPATLTELLTRADVAGLQGAVHAIGDAAITVVMDAYERSGAGGRIEHVQLIAPDQIARMARLELGASVQPCHLLDDRDTAERLWAGHTGDDFPFASLADAGVPLFFGSDAPVSPLDPWAAIEAAVTRTSGGREPWHPEQRLTVSQALTASTGGVSGLVPGAAADLIVLESNPFEVDPTDLSTLRPWLTMCHGQITYQR